MLPIFKIKINKYVYSNVQLTDLIVERKLGNANQIWHVSSVFQKCMVSREKCRNMLMHVFVKIRIKTMTTPKSQNIFQ